MVVNACIFFRNVQILCSRDVFVINSDPYYLYLSLCNLYLSLCSGDVVDAVVVAFVLGLDAIVLKGYETMTHSLTVTICFRIQR